MQTTWRPRPSERSFSPTARAVWPPIPASTSSKTSVRGPPPAAMLISASITRESSPPDALSRSGAAGTPGFGAIGGDFFARLELDAEACAVHRKLGQLLLYAYGQRRRRFGADRAEFLRELRARAQ